MQRYIKEIYRKFHSIHCIEIKYIVREVYFDCFTFTFNYGIITGDMGQLLREIAGRHSIK